jgi:hypothetical protein
MEKVAVPGGFAGPARKSVRDFQVLALASCLLCPLAVLAQDAPPEAVIAQASITSPESILSQARAEAAKRVSVQATALPRLEAQDTGFQAPRIDLSVNPFHGRAQGLGAVVGFSNTSTPTQGGLGLQQSRNAAVDLGVRWSQGVVDVTAWRRMNGPDDAYSMIQMREPVYGARVEMNLASAKALPFAIDRGFLGMQLESGARISIKRRNGGPMVYYRSSF